jgi:hypothetical protein
MSYKIISRIISDNDVIEWDFYAKDRAAVKFCFRELIMDGNRNEFLEYRSQSG